jgi:hypothetical protein
MVISRNHTRYVADFLAVMLFIGLSVIAVKAQNVEVTARADSNHILIGDWLHVTLEAHHPADVTVQFPHLPDSLPGFAIIRQDTPSVKASGGQSVTTVSLVVTSFDTGMQVFPAIPARYARRGDTAYMATSTSPVPVTVKGVAVDTSKDIRDVKPPMGVPITFADILPYLIGVIVLAGLIWLIRYIIRKRAKGESLLPEEPARPPYEVAIEALKALESEKLWQRGKLKEYHSQLSDIVRGYIEGRFSVKAMEMVTDEILAAPEIRALPSDIVARLKDELVLADLVKFAKYQPVAAENDKSLESSYTFVEKTRVADDPVPPPVLPATEEVKQG